MQWITEVELVDTVGGLKSSCSVRGFQMPNFEVLGAGVASALGRIIHNSHFKRRVSLKEQKAQEQDRFLRGRQIAYLIYDYFRDIGIQDSVENYADLFTISLRNDDIQEFDSNWDGILLSMTKISLDDILEGLCKLRIRESGKLKTVLELYEISCPIMHDDDWSFWQQRHGCVFVHSCSCPVSSMSSSELRRCSVLGRGNLVDDLQCVRSEICSLTGSEAQVEN